MTDSPADIIQASGLESAFGLPDRVIEANPDLRDLYDEIVANLRAEAFGIPMSTMQVILIERLATKYILIRHYERTGWLGVNAEKDANAQWSDLMKEWNRLLAQGHTATIDRLLETVEKIAKDGIALIEDKEQRQLLRNHFESNFAAIGH